MDLRSTETKTVQKIHEAIISTLAFFALYELPLNSRRVQELLLNQIASLEEVEAALRELARQSKIIQSGSLYSTKVWNQASYLANQQELIHKWEKIGRYFNWLALVPFVRNVSVINSLSLGTADSDSDIDFFVITKPRRLYVVRSMIIVLFRLLGVYKTREKIKDRFCFGFFVSPQALKFEPIMLKPQDPYFLFWLASMRPVFGGQAYWQLMQANQWLAEHFPNFKPMQRLSSAKQPGFFILTVKYLLEVLLWIPALLAEPILRRIHITHTFKLAENNTVTSTTIANAGMLKLHAYDVRAEVAAAFERTLQSPR